MGEKMALINCPECGRRVSDKALSCVHCGYPLKAEIQEEEYKNAINERNHSEIQEEKRDHANTNKRYNKTKIAVGLSIALIIVVFLFGPTIYTEYINSQPIYKDDIVGTWYEYENSDSEIQINIDDTLYLSCTDYFMGTWEILDRNSQTISLKYIVFDTQAKRYNNDFEYELDGVEATTEEVLEFEQEAHEGEFPPEGVYRYDRSKDALFLVEDEDVVLVRD